MKSSNDILIPSPTEHAYNLGWTSYNSGATIAINPYDMEIEETLYNAWVDGYNTAQRMSTT